MSSEIINHEQLVNGTFLAGVELQKPQNIQSSLLLDAVNTVAGNYTDGGELSFALSYIQDQSRPVPLTDNWRNGALDALADSPEVSGFNDTTSGGG